MAFGNVRSGYPLPLSVARLFGQPIVVVNAAALNRSPWYEVRNEASKVINDMGIGSAIAQGLVGRSGPNPITEVHRLGETDARVYLLAQQEPGHPPVAVGLLKVGKKNLFHFDTSGRTTELRDQMCVLDFYVHEDWQRGGFGKMLFEAMLSNEGVDPSQLAYDVRARVLARSHPPDACPAESRVLGSRCVSLLCAQRPSPKLIGFMAKHFGLSDFVPQQNKFVIFKQFFADKPRCARGAVNTAMRTPAQTTPTRALTLTSQSHVPLGTPTCIRQISIYDSVKDRPLSARGNHYGARRMSGGAY